MFSSGFVNTIEMAFWFVRFVENYENVYKTAIAAERMDGSEESLFSKVTSNLIKFSRYLVKYITSFEKVLKSANKNVEKQQSMQDIPYYPLQYSGKYIGNSEATFEKLDSSNSKPFEHPKWRFQVK